MGGSGANGLNEFTIVTALFTFKTNCKGQGLMKSNR